MKNMIFTGILAAVFFYIILMIVEAGIHPQVWPAAIAGGVLLAGLAHMFNVKNEHAVHTGEVVLLWTMIGLFAAYGLLAFFGGFTWS